MARRWSCIWFLYFLLWLVVFSKCDVTVTQVPIYEYCALLHYDYYNLTAVTWILSLDQDNCLPLVPHNASLSVSQQGCTLSLGICKRLAISGPCGSSSVCQQSSEALLSLGAYVDNPFNVQDPLPHGLDGFHTNFFEGTPYKTKTNASCQLETSITFQCNHASNWDLDDKNTGKIMKAPDPIDIHYDDSNCQLKLTFDYSGACKKSSDHKYLSVGSVLIIIFFITLFLYLIMGLSVNAIRGRSGSQLIPNVQFWTMLLGYIKGGCLFVFCCRSGSDSYIPV